MVLVARLYGAQHQANMSVPQRAVYLSRSEFAGCRSGHIACRNFTC